MASAKSKRSAEVWWFWPDPHAPCIHKDYFEFIKEVERKYGKFTRCFCIGDEANWQSISYHERDPDLPNAGEELELIVEGLLPWYKRYPKMELVHSNHGDLIYRQGRTAGLSYKVLKPRSEVLKSPKGWKWYGEIKAKTQKGYWIYIHHGLSKHGLQLTREMGMSTVQGHYHTVAGVSYTSTPHALLWALQLGVSFDKHHPAMRWALRNQRRPILGTGLIINGWPRYIPMPLNNKGSWTGEVP